MTKNQHNELAGLSPGLRRKLSHMIRTSGSKRLSQYLKTAYVDFFKDVVKHLDKGLGGNVSVQALPGVGGTGSFEIDFDDTSYNAMLSIVPAKNNSHTIEVNLFGVSGQTSESLTVKTNKLTTDLILGLFLEMINEA